MPIRINRGLDPTVVSLASMLSQRGMAREQMRNQRSMQARSLQAARELAELQDQQMRERDEEQTDRQLQLQRMRGEQEAAQEQGKRRFEVAKMGAEQEFDLEKLGFQQEGELTKGRLKTVDTIMENIRDRIAEAQKAGDPASMDYIRRANPVYNAIAKTRAEQADPEAMMSMIFGENGLLSKLPSAPDPNKNPTLPEQFEGEHVTDDKGVTWTRSKDGNWESHMPPKDESEKRELEKLKIEQTQQDHELRQQDAQLKFKEMRVTNLYARKNVIIDNRAQAMTAYTDELTDRRKFVADARTNAMKAAGGELTPETRMAAAKTAATEAEAAWPAPQAPVFNDGLEQLDAELRQITSEDAQRARGTEAPQEAPATNDSASPQVQVQMQAAQMLANLNDAEIESDLQSLVKEYPGGPATLPPILWAKYKWWREELEKRKAK